MSTGPFVGLAIALPFLVAAVTPALARLLGDSVGYLGALTAAVSFGLVLTQVGTEATAAVPWIPSQEIALRLHADGLAVLFGLLASGIGVLIFAYSATYMHGKPNLGRFYAALLAFMGSVLGVAFAADTVLLFVFWELTSVTSFVLIGYHTGEAESRYAARMAMVVTVGGGICLLLGLLLVGVAAELTGIGAFDLASIVGNAEAIRATLEANGLFVPALVLLTVAAAAKSAQVPLYFWLPRAMAAPTPVSAFLHSATMVKVGVYALGRLRPVFYSPEWTVVVATLGLATMTVGAVLAVLASDIKELLAYSTASHLGLMVAGFGFRSHYGPEAGVFHLFNHALFKAALFLVAGIVAHQAGTRAIDDLGGLRRDLPVTAAITLVAALSMAGIPPFNGFYSKEMLFEAAWETALAHGGLAWLYPATAVFASVFTVFYSLRFLRLFFGGRKGSLGPVERPSPLLVGPPAVLAVAAAAVSVAPQAAIDALVGAGINATTVEPVEVHAGLPTHLSGPVAMSAVAILAGVAAFPKLGAIRSVCESVRGSTRAVHPTAVYDRTLSATDRLSARTGAVIHSGRLRTYVWWLLLSACSLMLLGFGRAAVGLPTPAVGEVSLAMVLVLGVAVIAAVAAALTDTQVTGVLTLGILGYMVAIFYILASGPDLAVTQLVVESLTLLIFLLVLEQLPSFYGELERSVLARDALLSTFVGGAAFVAVLVATDATGEGLTETAEFYVDTAVPEGGGANVVNVILTDFRAFDTLGEAVVIVVAALSVFVLLAMRTRGETQ